MKKFVTTKKVTIEQAWIKLHKLEMDMPIEEVWLSVNMVLNKDNNAPMDYFNEELINQSEVMLKKTHMTYEDDGVIKSFNKYSLATFIADIVFGTFDALKEKNIPSFKAYIDEAKDVLKKYMKDNWELISKIPTVQQDTQKDDDRVIDVLESINNRLLLIEQKQLQPVEVKTSKRVTKKTTQPTTIIEEDIDELIVSDNKEVWEFSIWDFAFKTKKL